MQQRRRHERFVVWLVGFLLTGKIAHGVSRFDLRGVSASQWALALSQVAVVALGATWVYVYVPRSFVAFLLAWTGYILGLRVALWLLAWAIGEVLVGYDRWRRRAYAP